jgi:malate dehydrogenase (oxaloacetate-decarboxylating)
MNIAAAHAIAEIVVADGLRPDYIIPNAMDLRVAPRVAVAVARVAMETGEARQTVDAATIEERCRAFVYDRRRRTADTAAQL